jgi:hypothetical protein
VEAPYLLHRVDWTRFSACDVFDEASQKTLRLRGVDHHGRDLRLAEHAEGFKPTFAANEIVLKFTHFLPAPYRDWALEPDRLNIVNDLLMLPSIASTRAQDVDLGD